MAIGQPEKTMSKDRLVMLGTKGGPSLRSTERMPTSMLLESGGMVCVIDCGLGVTSRIVDAGVKLADIDCIFITHLHSDHVLELGPLLYTAWTTDLDKTVSLYGPEGTGNYLAGFFQAMDFDICLRVDDEGRPDLREMVDVHHYGEGLVKAGQPEVHALRVVHPPVEECYALRFDINGWRITFGADTAYFPPLMDFARGSDILIHEAMMESAVDELVGKTKRASRLKEHLHASHTTVRDVGRIAAGANVETLVMNHLVPVGLKGTEEENWLADIAQVWSKEAIVAHDGLEIWRK